MRDCRTRGICRCRCAWRWCGGARGASQRRGRRRRRCGLPGRRVRADAGGGAGAWYRARARETGRRRPRGAGPCGGARDRRDRPDPNVPLGMPAFGSGGGYDGPLAYRMGKPMCPDVAAAFDRTAAAARSEAGLFLSINSAFRSDAEQARLSPRSPTLICFPLCKPHSRRRERSKGRPADPAKPTCEIPVRQAAGVSRCAPAAGALRYAS